jgi:hypothetical protein
VVLLGCIAHELAHARGCGNALTGKVCSRRQQIGDWNTPLRDCETLAFAHAAQKVRQMRLGFVSTYGLELHCITSRI